MSKSTILDKYYVDSSTISYCMTIPCWIMYGAWLEGMLYMKVAG